MTKEQLERGVKLSKQIEELKNTIHHLKLYTEAEDDNSTLLILKLSTHLIRRTHLTLDTLERMINNLEHALSSLQKQFDEL